MRRSPLSRAAAVVGIALFSLAPLAPARPGDSPKKLLREYFKAKKDADRVEARKAIDESPPLDPKDVEDLRDEILEYLAKAAPKVPAKGRNEWFTEKEQERNKWESAGLYFSGFKGRKGLVLGLHGGGAGSGDAGSAQGSFAGPIGGLGCSAVFPEVLRKTEYGWTDPPETERWVMELVKRARVSWGIDPNRVYVTGHSMGGYGTWTYGSLYADTFAGGAAFAGAPTVYWKDAARKDIEAEAVVEGYLPNLYNLPLFVFQSLDDPQVPAAANVFACARLRELHEKEPAGWRHLYEEVNGLGHGFPRGGPKAGLEWMASHERNPRPVKIVWQPVREWKRTFYWLRWDEVWLNSLVTATRDAARNAFDIVVERPRSRDAVKTEALRELYVKSLSVYLDDRVLDLSREVVLTVDGKVRYRGMPELRLGTLLRSCEEREDPEYAFAAEVKVGEVQETPTGK